MKFAGGADEEDQAGAMHLASRLALAVRPSGAAGVGGACCLALAVRLCAAGGGALGGAAARCLAMHLCHLPPTGTGRSGNKPLPFE